MFIIEDEPKFTHTVKIQVPVDGGFREDAVKATFRVLPIDEIAAYDLNSPAESLKFLQATIVKLDDIVDVAKQPVPYSDELRDRVLQLHYARAALANAYFDGVNKGRAGN